MGRSYGISGGMRPCSCLENVAVARSARRSVRARVRPTHGPKLALSPASLRTPSTAMERCIWWRTSIFDSMALFGRRRRAHSGACCCRGPRARVRRPAWRAAQPPPTVRQHAEGAPLTDGGAKGHLVPDCAMPLSPGLPLATQRPGTLRRLACTCSDVRDARRNDMGAYWTRQRQGSYAESRLSLWQKQTTSPPDCGRARLGPPARPVGPCRTLEAFFLALGRLVWPSFIAFVSRSMRTACMP